MKKFILWIALLSILSNANVSAQSCGFISSSEINSLYQELNSNDNQRAVKVNWYIVKDDNGNGSNTESFLETLISQVEYEFQLHNITLAREECVGLIPVHNTTLSTAKASSDSEDLCNFDTYCSADALNVFLLDEQPGLLPGHAGVGLAKNGSNLCFIKVGKFGDFATIAHEIGHCFGLWHTNGTRPMILAHDFGLTDEWVCNDPRGLLGKNDLTSSCDGSVYSNYVEFELVDGTNASTSGDFVVDTPPDCGFSSCNGADPDNYFVCGESNRCTDQLERNEKRDPNCQIYQPDWNNFMQAFSNKCCDHFTDGQGSRMRAVIDLLFNEQTEKVKPVQITSNTIWNSDRFSGDITIEENKTLTIKNMTLRMFDESQIYLKRGSKLYVDNSMITSQNDCKWEGIRTPSAVYGDSAEGSEVRIKNNSNIDNARHGVSLELNYPKPFLETSNSSFKNCEIGINYTPGVYDNTRIYKTTFERNEIGINTFWSQGNIDIAVSDFIHNTTAIKTHDSYLDIKYECNFSYNKTAIWLTGSFPMGSGVNIGRSSGGANSFDHNELDILSNGIEHPLGVHVVNNVFSYSNGTEILTSSVFAGANDVHFSNNLIHHNNIGVAIWSTGDNENDFNCNDYTHNNVDNFFIYNNEETEFLENYSFGNNEVNYYFASTTMKPEIGTPGNAAANCFASNTIDFASQTNPNVPSAPFKYYYFDDGITTNCQEPVNPGNYSKIQENTEGDNCQLGVGILDLIDPDGDGDTGVDLDNHDPDLACKSCILTDINIRITTVVNGGGDDPRTIINEKDGASVLSSSLEEDEEILDQWIQYGLYIAMATQDYFFAEQILNPLLTWRWQKRLYGVQILKNDYIAAQNVLNSLDNRTTDQVQFIQIQQINLKRLLDARDGTSTVSPADISYLQSLADSREPSMGYARGLYTAITGLSLPITFPAGNGLRNTSSLVSSPMVEQELILYPNPVNEALTIRLQSGAFVSEVYIYDITGRMVMDHKYDSSTIKINMSDFHTGIYIISIHQKDGKIINKRIFKK